MRDAFVELEQLAVAGQAARRAEWDIVRRPMPPPPPPPPGPGLEFGCIPGQLRWVTVTVRVLGRVMSELRAKRANFKNEDASDFPGRLAARRQRAGRASAGPGQ